MNIDQAWYFLSPEQKEKIRDTLPHVSETDEDGNEIDGFVVLENDTGVTGRDHWDFVTKREARGNVLKAAKEIWLNSAQLFDREHEFLEVLKLGGLSGVIYNDPNQIRSGVYPAYLNIRNPLEASNIPENVIEALKEAGKRKRGKQGRGADQWDKRYLMRS